MKESKIFSRQNLSEKVHYVYRVTIDEHYYIGKHTGLLNDLHRGAYATSSKLVLEKLQNGMTFSKIKILQVFSSSKEALAFESRILVRVNAKRNPKFLNQSNGGGEFTCKQHTEKTKKKLSEITKEQFDINTEQGRQNRESHSEKLKEYYNPETEEGRRNRENQSQLAKARLDINTEYGRKRRENHRNLSLKQFDKNTELGRKRREIHSKIMKEKAKVSRQKRAETLIQKRKNASILGDLMFDEGFIRENFLIIDNKNSQRFLSSVYSKLTGYSMSHICEEKRIGKLSFLYGIESISISEEDENAKIKEIEQLLKSKNEKE